MKKAIVVISVFVFALVSIGCSKKLTSEGTSLEPIVSAGAGAVGKTYTLTLSQLNIERDSTSAYIRLFDEKYNTIFVYIPKPDLNNKILNLKRNDKYLYKFKVTKNESTVTLSGELIDVAGLDGIIVSGTLADKTPTACSIILDGPAAQGKDFTMDLTFYGKGEEEGKKKATFNSTDDYGKEVICTYADDLAKKIDELKSGDKCKVSFKVDKIDWRVFATLASVEKAQ